MRIRSSSLQYIVQGKSFDNMMIFEKIKEQNSDTIYKKLTQVLYSSNAKMSLYRHFDNLILAVN